MNKFILPIACTLAAIVSCDALNVNCDECYTDEPIEASMQISLGANNRQEATQLFIYQGKLEDNILIHTDTTVENSYSLTVNLNQYYTVKAIYKINGKSYIAIDGGDFDTKLITDNCEYDCYIIKGGKYDVKLND